MRTTESTTSSYTALIADADASVRELCRTALEQGGYTVCEATSDRDLVRLADDQQPDIIIADALFLAANPAEVLRSIRASVPGLGPAVLVLADSHNDPRIITNLARGVNDYMIKPVRPGELAVRVDTLMHRYASEHELHRSHELLGEHARILTTLLDLGAALAGTERLDSILQTALEALISAIPCRRAAILLPDSSLTRLRIAGALGLDDKTVANLVVPIGAGIAGRVYECGSSLIIEKASEASLDDAVHDLYLFEKPPALAMAMRASDRSIGVLYLADRVGVRQFTASEREYLGLLSNCAASAIDSALARRSREEAHEAITVALASLAEHRDVDTGRHLERMTGFCVILAERLKDDSEYTSKIDSAFIRDLRQAAPLHDVGKVAIPDKILLKPGKLTSKEMEIMHTHASIGAETIRSAQCRSPGSRFLAMAEEIAHCHHEWVDGSGYPCGLRGIQIPLSARIAAVADVYDALTTRRVYKNAMPHARARSIILGLSGRQFDPVVIEAFLASESAIQQLALELRDTIYDDGDAATSTGGTQPITTVPRDRPQLVLSRVSST